MQYNMSYTFQASEKLYFHLLKYKHFPDVILNTVKYVNI